MNQVEPGSGLAVKRPWAAVWTMLIGFFMLMLDATIVAVANPSIQQGLNASLTRTIWVTSAYLLALTVPLLAAGRLGDRFGQKPVFMAGMAVFTLASLLCGLASGIEFLIAARALQGFGGALMTPQTQAMIVRIFPPARRGAAMGLWGSVAGVAQLVGPPLGGLVVDVFGWQAIFLMNVPVGIAGLLLAAKFLPKLPTKRPSFDWFGLVISGLGLFLVVFGLQEGESNHWGRIWGPVGIWHLVGAGLTILAGFVYWQTRRQSPLVPLRLFRDRDFAVSTGAVSAMGFTVAGMALPMLYFLQVARGFGPAHSALFMLPSAVLGGVVAPFVGAKVVGRIGANWVAGSGLLLLAGGLYWTSTYMTPASPVYWMLVPSAVMGVANACIWSPLAVSATHNLSRTEAGTGSGVYAVIRQMGSVLGASCMNALMNARLMANGLPTSAAAGHSGGLKASPAMVDGFAAAMSQAMYLPMTAALVGSITAFFLTGQGGRSADAAKAQPRGKSAGQ
ncbi:MAG: DHA2 family efflux MFS transporter permease subunit [Micrococcales bacterium]|nr:DHA2 family efflux MFS transporter permease subunit [Micrococcales bacterium]